MKQDASESRAGRSEESAVRGAASRVDSVRLYPLPRTEEDARFTVGLLLDVDSVLTKHGYPSIAADCSGRDLVALRQALFRFLYVGDDR